MSSKAFGLTAYYDAMIANWFNNRLDIQFQKERLSLEENKNFDMVKTRIRKVRFM